VEACCDDEVGRYGPGLETSLMPVGHIRESLTPRLYEHFILAIITVSTSNPLATSNRVNQPIKRVELGNKAESLPANAQVQARGPPRSLLQPQIRNPCRMSTRLHVGLGRNPTRKRLVTCEYASRGRGVD